MAPEVLFGTGLIGTAMTDLQDPAAVTTMLNVLKQHKINRIDTAARYPPMNPGRAEELLGQAGPSSHAFIIDTKVLVLNIQDGSGHLTPEAVSKSMSESLTRLGSDSVETLYAHMADPATPVKDQVEAFNQQIRDGKCKQYGLSNHSVSQVRAIVEICEGQGLLKPAVYQGEYNLITRGMEAELLPLLRKHGIRYYAYRPLAAGFLSGKAINNQTEGTRMAEDSPLAAAYKQVYGSSILHQAMREFQAAVERFQLLPLEIALRWVYYHSALSDGDGLILGLRSASQLEEDMQWINKGPLPLDVVEIADGVWEPLRESRGSVL